MEESYEMIVIRLLWNGFPRKELIRLLKEMEEQIAGSNRKQAEMIAKDLVVADKDEIDGG